MTYLIIGLILSFSTVVSMENIFQDQHAHIRLQYLSPELKDHNLCKAVINKDSYMTNVCLNVGANAFSIDGYGYCAINYCTITPNDDNNAKIAKNIIRTLLVNRLRTLNQEFKNYIVRCAVCACNYDVMIFCLDIGADPLALDEQGFCAINFAIANPYDLNKPRKDAMLGVLMNCTMVKNRIYKSAIGSYLLIDALYKRNSVISMALCSVGVDMFTPDIFQRLPYNYMSTFLPKVGQDLYSTNANYKMRADAFVQYCEQACHAAEAQQPQKMAVTSPSYSQNDAAYLEALGIIFDPENPPTPHQILHVAENAALNVLKKAHRELRTLWHPDKFINKTEAEQVKAEKVSQLINQAYQYLINKTGLEVSLALEYRQKTVKDVADMSQEMPDLQGQGITSLDGLSALYARKKSRNTYVCLSDNKINVLTADDFRGMVMDNLTLSNNSIAKIHPLAFDCAEVSMTLDLSINNITSEQLAQLYLTSLSTLIINHNALEKIGQNTLSGLSNLTMLDVSYNKIKDVHPQAFANTLKIKKIDLAGNTLGLNKAKFKKLCGLEKKRIAVTL